METSTRVRERERTVMGDKGTSKLLHFGYGVHQTHWGTEIAPALSLGDNGKKRDKKRQQETTRDKKRQKETKKRQKRDKKEKREEEKRLRNKHWLLQSENGSVTSIQFTGSGRSDTRASVQKHRNFSNWKL